MARNEAERDPCRALARMYCENSQARELIDLLIELKQLRGDEGLEEGLSAMRGAIAQKRREQFRAVKGGRKARPEASA